ncbi:hypothetical protein N7495_001458 [Penicillium taxi]|uniref:uncharacterized protein n=1 Tax=Penicillium taxi TaxID=168475 RepID=UPI0025450E11|nr:uncharacterized protein N7495_001458 [Penicillium taxi]KAJ5908776.1 hypothetical protein N7495_001458 [Penicillium taxi]
MTVGAHIETDVIVIGGGFGGCNSLYKLRQLGLSVKLIEAGGAFGGVWYWNRYPGARVDSEMISYQFNIPAIYESWAWSERFPGDDELRRYFQHVSSVLELNKDTFFNTIVTGVTYDPITQRWAIRTNTGLSATCQYVIAATGSSYKKYYPEFKGLQQFTGKMVHAADYPKSLNVKGKRVGVIGNGNSGVQIVQTLAQEDCQLKVFIRTPTFALPMRQRDIQPDEVNMLRGYYEAIFNQCYQSNIGLPCKKNLQSAHQATPEERKALFDELWEKGGFGFMISNYVDTLVDEKANGFIYDYWVQRVRARMTDPEKMDLVAPLKQKMPVATKRPSLEQNYYEMIDRDNVTLHDVNRAPILEFNETGLMTGDDAEKQHHELDIIILATGYDAVTGSLLDLSIRDMNQVSLSEKWKHGIITHLGMMVPDMPNLFMVYGPQAPTSLTNGPVFIDMQVDWICKVITKMQRDNLVFIVPTQKAAEEWRDHVHLVSRFTLHHKTPGWYFGVNIPGKIQEPLIYFGGIQLWWKSCTEALEHFKGFSTLSRDVKPFCPISAST